MFVFDEPHTVKFSEKDFITVLREDLLERLGATYQANGGARDVFVSCGLGVNVDGIHASVAWIRGVALPNQGTIAGGIVTLITKVAGKRVTFDIKIECDDNEYVRYIADPLSFRDYPA